MPSGKGRESKYNTFDEECRSRKGIITINNSDTLCLTRAFVVAQAYVNKDQEYKNLRLNSRKLQTHGATKLTEDAGVFILKSGCRLFELQKLKSFSQRVSNYCL